jgi:hypothetical protein
VRRWRVVTRHGEIDCAAFEIVDGGALKVWRDEIELGVDTPAEWYGPGEWVKVVPVP